MSWRKLSDELREELQGKLQGLYGGASSEAAFDNLTIDKQQALVLFARRLDELALWPLVRRVENVYGEGGVGMNFTAWPALASELQRRKDFTARFASHRDNDGGFIELGRGAASLHFLYQGTGAQRRWGVHFDLYNPWASPASAWRHLLREKIGSERPDWRVVRTVFRREGKLY
ncbi:MAG TPA: hypothetical protein VJS44_09025 [Pyrinomonadaceae bacterium]|nr:hypothetical protein [Pyrinomonadaceae bacterium]